jgi:D-amino-acid oxidase
MEIPRSELQNDIHNAFTFTSVCINTAIYLPWLVSQCLKAGVIFKRAVFNHIIEASQAHHSGLKANLIVNCTGISARKLGGVMDQTMIPVRGQIVVVRNDANGNFSVSSTDDGPEESAYLMSRAAGGGTILGGCSQKGNWESQPDPNLAIRIMKRCITLCPRLVGGNGGIEHLDIIRHGVGLRPFREGGTRIEKEVVKGNVVVHNYGHGSFGYQASYGCAEIAVNLVEASS